MKSSQSAYDVLIVGGGPVGLTLAHALVSFLPGLRLGLLDRRALAVPTDLRASAIAAGGRHLFEALGLWDRMAPDANPVRGMRITDSGEGDLARPVLLAFEEPESPGAPIAHMVPNTASTGALIAACAGSIDIVAPGAVAGFDGSGPLAAVTLADGRSLSARLVIAADGGRSTLRGLAAIRSFSHDYRQSGVVTTIGHSLPHGDFAYEHFRPAGPFASLPLSGDRSSLVWAESPQRAAGLLAMRPEDLAREIEAAMGTSLGAVEVLDAVQSFPLHLLMAHKFAAPRLALVGDAAHVIHPLAGQGLNLGLKDVAVLAEVLVDAARLGEDIGALGVLERYESRRQADTALMAVATDGLNRLFSNDAAPLRGLRDFGLSIVDRIGPLKEGIIAQAAGTGGAKLLKGLPL
ncbi:FAD-dependent monooxygenase [Pelagibacterium lacus]|uniref:2-octaprenyl-6-methoxyphenyl hydroxylase n=1 Tax=Pelagibacterium lacus TaxID=2282655 RepID=A0A369W570_9HYPH|nr:FAD-dependent monooxygenase [Pelagibacterium lacus]RDE08510.1 2-octaprenyl-6-methoxyphenyl hydroxylase [Pelagibacterium lacus]